MNVAAALLLALSSLVIGVPQAFAAAPRTSPEFQPSRPESTYLSTDDGVSLEFCEEWNPEFAAQGYQCCATKQFGSAGKRRRRAAAQCAPGRNNYSRCSELEGPEMKATRDYIADIQTGVIPAESVLNILTQESGRYGNQAMCSASTGFLAHGRPLVPTKANRIELRAPERCANFGTDALVGVMEYLGNEVSKEFSEPEFEKSRIVVGDLSAPKGGCLAGRFNRRAHKSHTNGLDIDIAFFNPRAGHPPEERFTNTFYVSSNWWLLKKMVNNPFACVKNIFLDRKLIRQLECYANKDPDWKKIRSKLQHVRGHRNHFHIRVGSGPGEENCLKGGELDLEDGDGGEEGEGEDFESYSLSDALNELEQQAGAQAKAGDASAVESDSEEDSTDAGALAFSSERPISAILKVETASSKSISGTVATRAAEEVEAIRPDFKLEPLTTQTNACSRSGKVKKKRSKKATRSSSKKSRRS